MSEPAEQREQLSSVTLSRNAKGGVQIDVKIYDPDPAAAKARAVQLYDELATKYPMQG